MEIKEEKKLKPQETVIVWGLINLCKDGGDFNEFKDRYLSLLKNKATKKRWENKFNYLYENFVKPRLI